MSVDSSKDFLEDLTRHAFKENYHYPSKSNNCIVFDGNALSKELSSNISDELKKSCLYGYNNHDYYLHVSEFFTNLLNTFKLVPIVIFDGCTKMDMERNDLLDNMIGQFDTNSSSTIKIIQYPSTITEQTPFWPSATTALYQVLRDFKIFHNQTIFEADDVVASFAQYFKCPIVAKDRDYLFMDLSVGVIHLNVFMQIYQASLGINLGSIECNGYLLVKGLKNNFPQFNVELLPLVTPFVKYASKNPHNEAGKRFITKLTEKQEIQERAGNVPVTTKYCTANYNSVDVLIHWLSKQGGSFEDVKKQIVDCEQEVREMIDKQLGQKKVNPNKNNTILDSEHVIPFVKTVNKVANRTKNNVLSIGHLQKGLSIEEFNRAMYGTFFPEVSGIQNNSEIHQGLVSGRINPLLLKIRLHRIEQFSQKIEDLNIAKCSDECCFVLCEIIYELILGGHDDEMVTIIYRAKPKGKVVPRKEITISGELPTLEQIGHMDADVREKWLLNIIGHACVPVEMNIKSLSDAIQNVVNENKQKPLLIMLLSLIMCNCKCPEELASTSKWSAFLQAMFAQIINLVDPNQVNLSNAIETTKTIAKLDLQITYAINQYENCLKKINFLVQCLCLYDTFGVDRFLCGLQGSLIYNLTVMLATEESNCFKNEILRGNKTLIKLAAMIAGELNCNP